MNQDQIELLVKAGFTEEHASEFISNLIYPYKILIEGIIETLDGRDNSVKSWIEEQLKEIEEM